LPLLGLNGLRAAGLQALRHVVKATLPENLLRPLIIVTLSIGLWSVYQQSLTASQVMLFNLLAVLISFVIGTVWLAKSLPSQVQHVAPAFAESDWLKVSLPLFFVTGLHLVLSQTDILMIGVLMDAKQAGIYAVASRCAGLLAIGLTAVNAIAAPLISELYSTGKHQQLQKMITLAARGVFVFTLVVGIFLVFSGEFLLSLLGQEFVIGYNPLLILLMGQVVNALSGSVGFLMTMTGFHNQAVWILGVSTLLNIVLNILLITKLGLIGAAIATAVTTALWNFLMLVFVFRRLNINPTVLAGVQ
jgi:O-antigen/teichoic acid export membrane protein